MGSSIGLQVAQILAIKRTVPGFQNKMIFTFSKLNRMNFCSAARRFGFRGDMIVSLTSKNKPATAPKPQSMGFTRKPCFGMMCRAVIPVKNTTKFVL